MGITVTQGATIDWLLYHIVLVLHICSHSVFMTAPKREATGVPISQKKKCRHIAPTASWGTLTSQDCFKDEMR